MDEKYPRYKGKSYYDKLRESDPEFDSKVNKDLSDIYDKYNEKYPSLKGDYETNYNGRNK